MATIISRSAAETEAVGESWGRTAESGLIIGLSGDLGSGKTQLVKGLARGLGISSRVHSPTFTLVNIYPGRRLLLAHLDLYRLSTPQEFIGAGLEEYLHGAGVTVIEWAERWFGDLLKSLPPSVEEAPPGAEQRPVRSTLGLPPGGLRWAQLDVLSESERRITYEDISG
jgi:tRNA threonylcarbamoyladenosine biosynthesis protein TsaE